MAPTLRQIEPGSTSSPHQRPAQGTDILLVAIQEVGLLFINGQLIDWLDLSHNLNYGDVSVMAGFYNGHTSEPEFENFIVWTP